MSRLRHCGALLFAGACARTPSVVLDGTLPRPIVVHADASALAPREDCLDLPIPADAAGQVIVSIERPARGLLVSLRPTPETSIRALVARVGDAKPAVCHSAKHVFERPQPGRYRVWAVSMVTNRAVPFDLIAVTDGTQRDPMRLARPPAANLPIRDRALELHYPEMLPEDLEENGALIARYFATAPLELFVYVSPESGRTLHGLLANEPLLVIDADWAIAADGQLIWDPTTRTTPSPTGPLQLPAEVRSEEVQRPLGDRPKILDAARARFPKATSVPESRSDGSSPASPGYRPASPAAARSPSRSR
jgi:hypothetical protein